ncbi:aminotransferase class IV [Halobacteriovorax sp. HFRX-2_2]|uniref:aminotransferase class IV n=1 Tax=unclassified Halobacteriovorax TaxID=2639665 RepID=UPI003715B11F
MEQEVIYFSKKGLTARDALINEGNLWGNSFFTTILVKGGKAIFWDQHRQRLEKSFQYCWPKDFDSSIIDEVQLATAKILGDFSSIPYAYLRITFYRELSGAIQFWIWAVEKDQLKSSLKLNSHCYYPDQNFPDFLKRSNYQYQFQLRRESLAQGYDDVLLLDPESYILELPTANIVLKKGDDYITPIAEFGVLDGISLERVKFMLEKLGRPLKEMRVHAAELHEFDSCFTTSSFNGIRHISTINEVAYTEDIEIKKLVNEFYGEIW